MNRVHIIGGRNHGKTRLIAELVRGFSAMGHRVGAIKHTHHAHELDTPGKDSFVHRQAGARVVGVVAKNLSAAFWPTPNEPSHESFSYEHFARVMESCDFVLVEGDQSTDGAKLEVWRAEIGTAPLAQENESILAVVSDDRPPVACPVHSRSDLTDVMSHILDLFSK